MKDGLNSIDNQIFDEFITMTKFNSNFFEVIRILHIHHIV